MYDSTGFPRSSHNFNCRPLIQRWTWFILHLEFAAFQIQATLQLLGAVLPDPYFRDIPQRLTPTVKLPFSNV